ncbi:MAG TPA: hypothetical protein VGK56_07615 [Anaerolineales bacterium]
MKNKERLYQRFMRDPIPRRLGNLSATLGRISSSARESSDPAQVANLLDEAKHLIEWTAADTDPEIAAELVAMQRLIVLWQKAWRRAETTTEQRILLATQAKQWSDQALEFSGLL